MVNIKDVLNTAKLSLTKNLVTSQDFQYITCKLNTAGQVFNSDGLSTGAASTSSLWIVHMGGFTDQRMTCSMKYVSPTAQAASQLGVIIAFQSFEVTADQTYYWARIQNGVARITKSVGATLTNLTSSNWALPQNQYATIAFSRVGSALSATFTDESSVLSPLTISATDSTAVLSVGGLMGFRSLSSSSAVKSFTAEQL